MIALAMMTGLALGFVGLKPVKMLFWSAVLNTLGWLGAAITTVAAVAMPVT